MFLKCLKCNFFNYPFENELNPNGFLKNTLNEKEDIYEYECSNCHIHNIIQTNIFSKDYSLNKKLWQLKKYNIVESLNIKEKVFIHDVEKYFYSKYYFNKINLNCQLLEKKDYIDSEGIYIVSHKDENIKFDKKVIFTCFENKLLLNKK